MSHEISAREIARRIVGAADSVLYLAESMGKSALPKAWTGGPALELRVRFNTRLARMDDAELSRWLRAMRITGPIRAESVTKIVDRHDVNANEFAPNQSWRPRGFGAWQLDNQPPMGVKVHESSQATVDLLIAVPPRFRERIDSEFAHWTRWIELPTQLNRFANLSGAIFERLRSAQSIAQIDAALLQDQSWCEPMREKDRGFVVPRVVCEACGWEPIPGSEREGWVGVEIR